MNERIRFLDMKSRLEDWLAIDAERRWAVACRDLVAAVEQSMWQEILGDE